MDLSNFIVPENTSICDAAAAINANSRFIVFVCGENNKLLAALSDGDIRRHVMRGGDLSLDVTAIANHNPVSLPVGQKGDVYKRLLQQKSLRAIPLVNSRGEIVSIQFDDSTNIGERAQLGIPVVIMAGGKGKRLAPYTDVLPKPLIPVGSKTITEHIIDRFLDAGCDDFTMIVNHKKELIKAYFNESPCKGKLRFVEEQSFQGTGGGLQLLNGSLKDTFFMTNCDILIQADYQDILEQHREQGNVLTMVCAMQTVSVPYGTVEMDDSGQAVQLIEKPEYPLLTNTGLYVIEPAFVDSIPAGAFVHITDLIQQRIHAGDKVGVYPISQNGWMDMGQMDALGEMQRGLQGEGRP